MSDTDISGYTTNMFTRIMDQQADGAGAAIGAFNIGVRHGPEFMAVGTEGDDGHFKALALFQVDAGRIRVVVWENGVEKPVFAYDLGDAGTMVPNVKDPFMIVPGGPLAVAEVDEEDDDGNGTGIMAQCLKMKPSVQMAMSRVLKAMSASEGLMDGEMASQLFERHLANSDEE